MVGLSFFAREIGMVASAHGCTLFGKLLLFNRRATCGLTPLGLSLALT